MHATNERRGLTDRTIKRIQRSVATVQLIGAGLDRFMTEDEYAAFCGPTAKDHRAAVASCLRRLRADRPDVLRAMTEDAARRIARNPRGFVCGYGRSRAEAYGYAGGS